MKALPLSFHETDCGIVDYWTKKWIHLGHVRDEPHDIAAYSA